MHDDKRPPDPLKRMRVKLDDEQDVIAMARLFGVTPQELRDAVATTGTDIAVLEEHFRTQ